MKLKENFEIHVFKGSSKSLWEMNIMKTLRRNFQISSMGVTFNLTAKTPVSFVGELGFEFQVWFLIFAPC